jgi:hypothetical protein
MATSCIRADTAYTNLRLHAGTRARARGRYPQQAHSHTRARNLRIPHTRGHARVPAKSKLQHAAAVPNTAVPPPRRTPPVAYAAQALMRRAGRDAAQHWRRPQWALPVASGAFLGGLRRPHQLATPVGRRHGRVPP